ncbi:MAG: helix-turn-helix transcriptional regulator [Candidatus Omnitrophica bacterium]|nr:helix-turn-helix transcriptional regulator [Candidatus Omnitrophota bacterium]
MVSELSQQIKLLRKNAGLTQIEFSKRAGVGLRFMRELEQGKASVRLDKVNKVLAFLGHHLDIAPNHDKKRISERPG